MVGWFDGWLVGWFVGQAVGWLLVVSVRFVGCLVAELFVFVGCLIVFCVSLSCVIFHGMFRCVFVCMCVYVGGVFVRVCVCVCCFVLVLWLFCLFRWLVSMLPLYCVSGMVFAFFGFARVGISVWVR